MQMIAIKDLTFWRYFDTDPFLDSRHQRKDKILIKKQFSYADRKNIPFVIIAGPEELEKGKYSMKNMKSGEQLELGLEEIISQVSIS